MDIETYVRTRNEFLTDEYILGIALATRTSGELTSPNGIDSEVLILGEQREEAEFGLLKALNEWFGKRRTLCLLGYGLRNYDVPLLIMKNQKYRKSMNQPLWKLIDALQQAAHIDLYFMLKTWYGVKNLHQAVEADAFAELALRRRKNLVSDDFKQKGEDIITMWKDNRDEFIQYAEADAVDTLLIAEYILKTR